MKWAIEQKTGPLGTFNVFDRIMEKRGYKIITTEDNYVVLFWILDHNGVRGLDDMNPYYCFSEQKPGKIQPMTNEELSEFYALFRKALETFDINEGWKPALQDILESKMEAARRDLPYIRELFSQSIPSEYFKEIYMRRN